ncbi:enolase-phosphatase E1 [Phthorimaea operculella]|nr:enolase-phosphatase E1 [Phthorimaea operculella]
MANDNKEIGDIVKKCKILLLDIEGTTTSISFVKDKLFPYAEENVKQFLDSQWDTDAVKDVVVALRKLSIEDKEGSVEGVVVIPGEDVVVALRKLSIEDKEGSVEGVVVIPGEDASKEDQIEGLVNNVKWQMSSDRKAGPLKQLQGLIWKQGYDNGDIKGHVYEDVSAALEAWHSADDQKVYIYSSGSVQAQKLLFGQSSAGDLLKFIDGHFDTAVGGKQEAASYTNIVEKIGCKADEILFLTDIVKAVGGKQEAASYTNIVEKIGCKADDILFLTDIVKGELPTSTEDASSSAGDLLKFIDGHFDTAVGGKQEAASYTTIVEKIGCKADDILFLTDIVKAVGGKQEAASYTNIVEKIGCKADEILFLTDIVKG